ncbi:Ig-like domain-containing protein, partial [Gillisia limnaea]
MKNFYSTLVSKSQFILQFLAYLICFFSYANVSLDPDTPKEVSEILGGHSDYINCLTFNANGDSLEVKQDNQKNTFDTTTSFSGYLEKGLERSDPKLQTVLNSVLATSYGPGGPILIIKSSSRPFSSYAAEILLAEGLNEFATSDISVISPELLSTYDVIIIGEIPLTEEQVTMLSNWAGAGGTLIAFRPDVKLAPLMGLTVAGGTLNDKYILINTSSGPGKGLVSQTIQYHSAADLYNLNGATSLATLYSGVNTATTNPAVSINNVGVNGGKAVAFTYDLARSIVYTRQGNPEWAGQERDGQPGPIRSNDIFFPDWVDLNKVAIPQADEQQRLLANIIVQNSRKPMPRFWYLPRGLKAAVVMTGDDHANNGTTARFNQYLQLSEDNSAAAVADWRAIRGTSYIFLNTPITNAEAKSFEDQGFEIALHLDTGCSSFTPSSFDNDLTNQLAEFKFRFPSITAPTTNRTHCIAYSDWATSPKLGSGKGIRLDANYYYWPESWVQNRPGMFTGSAMPMRFADLDGTIIDSYQLVTQMTDESGQNFPFTIDQLLDKALGPEGYYGMFCANMHTDADFSDGSDKIIASAKARNIPVISAKQVLTWLDGRNGSSFGSIGWNENKLNFSISVASGAHKLEGMVPAILGSIRIVGLTVNGEPATYRIETIKGIEYAFFSAINGEFVATYDVNTPPAVSITAPANNATFTAPATIVINATASDTDGTIAKVEFFQGTTKLGEDLSSPYSFSWSNAPAGTYSLTARASDDKTATTNSAAVNVTVNPDPGGFGCPCTVFEPTTGPTNQLYTDGQAVQLGMKFRSSENGFVSGVRFFKQAGNTGTHIGQLYSRTGSLLAQATFTNETASGWQEVAFSSPVAVTANTTYVISYHSGSGFYSASNPFFNSATVKTPLTGLQSGTDGPNGVYRYSGTPAFPNQNYQSSNYWVDVVFNTSSATNTPPAVAITAPANNATFIAPATIVINATASDTDGTIAKVEFFQGTTKLGEDLSSPYSFSWNNAAAGTYSLTARATDDKAAVTTSAAVNVTVSDSTNTPPTVAITAPANNATFIAPATIVVEATASDTDGTISKVEFFQGTTKLGEDLSSPYSFSWNNAAAGTYSLTARATDDKAAVTTSAAVNVTVSDPTNTPPTVAITAPGNNATFTAPASIVINATASDTDGTITKV